MSKNNPNNLSPDVIAVLQTQYHDAMKGIETDPLVLSTIEHNLRTSGYPEFADRVHNKIVQIESGNVQEW